MKSLYTLLLFSLTANATISDWGIQRRGYLTARLTSYTDRSVPNYGQATRAELEQVTTITDSVSFQNQLRWKSNSVATDISTKSATYKKDSYEVTLGENIFKYKGEGKIAQIGYQEVVWGESFGLNYADIINPKDQRETLFADAGEARLPLLLFNGKKLFSSGDMTGSMQILYSPEPRFSKTLPLDLFIGDKFPQARIEVLKEKTPTIFKSSEAGGKASISYNGFDTALFHYSYLDRDPSYGLVAGSTTTLTLQENHNRVHSTGFSITKPIVDFVLRSDVVYTKNKAINYLESNQIKTDHTNATNLLISFDTPSYDSYSAVFIFAQSSLQRTQSLAVREKLEQYSIVKLAKSFNDDKSFELAYTHEYKSLDNSAQAVLTWPLNNTIDIKLGGQFYWGDAQSNLSKYKKLNSVFFSLKNYFQL